MARSNQAPIVLKRTDEDHESEHHGGAWKVAYADFMTAMMAFFMLMWILSISDENQLTGIADYFAPAKVEMQAPGGTGPLAGETIGPKGVMNASRANDAIPANPGVGATTDPSTAMANASASSNANAPEAKIEKVAATAQGQATTQDNAENGAKSAAATPRALDDARFDALQARITQAIQRVPDLRPLQQNVIFRRTPDGLNIEVVDQAGKAMFASGSAKIDGPTLALMDQLGRALSDLPNDVLIAGHTDSVPYQNANGTYGNWELSSDRANATRRALVAAGVASQRITRISGLSDTDPLKPQDPRDPSNRRITVTLAYLQPENGAPATQLQANASIPSPQSAAVEQKAPDAGAPATQATADEPQKFSSIALDDLRSALQ
ncbi:flagellar motor protein MotB [Thioclava atlantica]|uniref:Chemotaxis MotB protein n=1 Tax=Thioclava atlantica TaxID=1317124 RepID=A0A085TYB5_9RHOB|nr:flagellar motor protein MotB [Thioclava atlantica]KFE35712.1 chemotaxis MotB protein [Thioclava atlantica]